MSRLLAYVLLVVQVLADLQLRMPMHMNTCPVCRTSYASINIVDTPCSQACVAQQHRDRTMRGTKVIDPRDVPDPKVPQTGKHRSGKTAKQTSGVKPGKTPAANVAKSSNDGCMGCAFVAVAGLAAITGGGLWAAFELASALLA